MDGGRGARWGIGRRERGAFGLGDFEQNTLKAALDRILLGAAADDADSEWLSLALPLDDVESNDIDLTGRLAEYVDRLDVSLRGLTGPQSAEQWLAALARALDLLVDVPRPTRGSWGRRGASWPPPSSTAATRNSGSRTCGRCCARASPAAPPAPTSAPGN